MAMVELSIMEFGTNMHSFEEVKTFTKAVVKYAKNGFKKVSIEEYKARIDVCNGCDKHDNGKCKECGCTIAKKAWWESEDCPLKKWARCIL